MAFDSDSQHEDDISLPETSSTTKSILKDISVMGFDHESPEKHHSWFHLRAYSIRISTISIATIILCAELLSLALSPQSTSKHHENYVQYDESPSPWTGTPAHSSQRTNCGNTTQSAIDYGCIFDPLTISWETQECYNAEIVNAFMQQKEWQLFTDINATSTVTWNEVAQAKRRYNVNWDFHFTHCIYTWKLLQMAVLKRMPAEDNLLALGHTIHCTDLLLDRNFSWDTKNTLIHVKWPKCYRHSEWKEAHFVDPFNVTAL